MPSLIEVRTAIADTLAAHIPGVNFKARMTRGVVVPAVVIYPADMDYLHTFRNSSTQWQFNLNVMAGTDEEFAQDPLDELVDARGDRSIPAVLLANPTFGRPDCHLMEPLTMSGYGARWTVGDSTYVGAVIRVGVIVTHA